MAQRGAWPLPRAGLVNKSSEKVEERSHLSWAGSELELWSFSSLRSTREDVQSPLSRQPLPLFSACPDHPPTHIGRGG